MNWNRIVALASLGLAACSQPPTQGSPSLQKNVATSQEDEAAKRARLNLQPVKWPMKFKEHSFSALCYDTLTCSIWYARLEHGDDRPTPPSSHYGPNYLDHWSGGHLGIRNFPGPAEVTWRTRDGEDYEAKIDIAEIFRDELIRHNVPRDEVSELPDGEYLSEPSILLEVNDRTIRVYTRALIPTRHFRIPDNPYSDYRDDLILVKTYNY